MIKRTCVIEKNGTRTTTWSVYMENEKVVEFTKTYTSTSERDSEHTQTLRYTGKFEEGEWRFYSGSQAYSHLEPRIKFEFQEKGISL
jgi:ribosome-associated toxin RatA of RatAB toxin-antitoxin module